MAKVIEKISNARRYATRRRASRFSRMSRSEWRAFAFLGAISLTFWALLTFVVGQGAF